MMYYVGQLALNRGAMSRGCGDGRDILLISQLSLLHDFFRVRRIVLA
jgi:hypothetical protein